MVNVSLSGYSASCDNVSEKLNLAVQTTSSVKGENLRRFGELTAAKETGMEI